MVYLCLMINLWIPSQYSIMQEGSKYFITIGQSLRELKEVNDQFVSSEDFLFKIRFNKTTHELSYWQLGYGGDTQQCKLIKE